MSPRPALLSCAAIILAATTARADQLAASAFRTCVDREAKAAVQRELEKYGENALYGYHNNLKNEVSSICKQRADGSTSYDDLGYVSAAIETQVKKATDNKIKKELEEQRRKDALDAPRLKAEKAEENEAGRAYYVCLTRHVDILALVSNETAEVVAKAAFPSCSEERQTVFNVYRRHNNYFSQGTMEAMESVFLPKLLLEVIKARAQPQAPPAPQAPPPKKQTPI